LYLVPVPGPWLRYVVSLVLAFAMAPVFLALAAVAIPVLAVVTLASSFTQAGRTYVGEMWTSFFTLIENIVRNLAGQPSATADQAPSMALDQNVIEDDVAGGSPEATAALGHPENTLRIDPSNYPRTTDMI